jgi:tetratricopeptide (TPR) repeat protein
LDLLDDGNKKYLKGDYKGAIKAFTKLLKTDKQNIQALINRGLAYLDLWKYNEAINDFSTVISIDEKNTDAYRNRALAYYSLNKERLALDDYKKATEFA